MEKQLKYTNSNNLIVEFTPISSEGSVVITVDYNEQNGKYYPNSEITVDYDVLLVGETLKLTGIPVYYIMRGNVRDPDAGAYLSQFYGRFEPSGYETDSYGNVTKIFFNNNSFVHQGNVVKKAN